MSYESSMNMSGVRNRRLKVVERLQNQLKASVKNTKEGKIELSDKDKTRINKEMETLKTRI